MGNRKVIFLAFSDLHYADMKPYTENRRIDDCDKALKLIGREAKEIGVPVLFCGDWYHNPNNLSNGVIFRSHLIFQSVFEQMRVPVIGIAGNHDQAENDTFLNKGPNYLDNLHQIFPSFTQLYVDSFTHKDYIIHGIPYFKNDAGFFDALGQVKPKKGKKNILLIHRDLPGAIDPNGMEMGMCEDITRSNINKIFKGYDLVLSGHIHKPQKLGSNVYMLGATHHQRTSDAGCDMGYWRIYSDLSLEFVKLELPQFKYINEGDEKPDNYNFYVTIPKAKNSSDIINHEFHAKQKPVKLGKAYLKEVKEKDKDKRNILIKYLKKI